MEDPRSQSEHDEEHDGASPSELIIEAARRNNTELLQSTLSACTSPEASAELLNSAKTVLGNYAYHEAASHGNWEVIDMMLDQEGFECDPINKREGDTPLHCVVRYINENGRASWDYGGDLVAMMLEAGSDARIRNKAKLKPADLVDPQNKALREKLAEAEYMHQNAGDFVDRDVVDRDEEDDEDTVGSNSDSDFDEGKEDGRK